MTSEQIKTVNRLGEQGYRVIVIKRGFAFMVSTVKNTESVLRVSPTGDIKEMTE